MLHLTDTDHCSLQDPSSLECDIFLIINVRNFILHKNCSAWSQIENAVLKMYSTQFIISCHLFFFYLSRQKSPEANFVFLPTS